MSKIFRKRNVLAFVLVLVILLGVLGAVSPDASVERKALDNRCTVLSAENWNTVPSGKNGTKITDYLLNGKKAEGKFEFKKSDSLIISAGNIKGNKKIGFVYSVKNAKSVDTIFNCSIGGASFETVLPIVWKDTDGEYETDRFGNEIAKNQCNPEFSVFTPLFDKRDINLSPLFLELNGSDKITVTNKTQTVTVYEIWIYSEDTPLSYSDYLKKISASEIDGLITLQGEEYALKSDSVIRASCVNIAGMHPYNTYTRMINSLNGSSWSNAGQKLLWEFEVPKSGFYNLGFRFCQNSASNKKVYRNIEIDGKTKFGELKNIPFEQTSSQSYKTKFIGDEKGREYSIYLEKGRHTVAMVATLEKSVELYNRLNTLISEMNLLGIDITKLTAGVTDKNRTWDLDTYLPGALDKIRDFVKRIDGIYNDFCKLEGEKATYADDLLYAVNMLENLLSSPRTIPNRMEKFSSGDSSAVKYVTSVLNEISFIPLDIDEIYFKGTKSEFKETSVPILSKMFNSAKKFAYSMTPEAVSGGYNSKNSKALNVWVSRSSVYVQALQTMFDSDKDFSNDTINISIMPSEQKLILSSAAGTTPDVVLGCAYTTPYKFAIRNAAKNLLEYKDFISFYTEQYNAESLVPFYYDGGIYGAVETQDYNVLFYRKDILKALKIPVPDTWDDVKEIMPTLLRYNKNFSLPIANVVGYKSFALTSPYIYQNGGEYYTNNGEKTDFLSEKTLNGFSELTELFKIYSVKEYVASFYNSFRSGDCPLGLGGVSTYVQLTEAAPELTGLWDIAPAPGIKMQNGQTVRYNCADTTACMIFKNTKQSALSWKFLKKWLSYQTQITFANTMERSYGNEYRWNTANLKAFDQTTYSEEHKQVINKMWESQKEIIQHPAGYIVEREISNAFTNVVVNGETVIDSVEDATLVADREITRKLKEFGFCDSEGKIIKDYPINAMEEINKLIKKSGDGNK